MRINYQQFDDDDITEIQPIAAPNHVTVVRRQTPLRKWPKVIGIVQIFNGFVTLILGMYKWICQHCTEPDKSASFYYLLKMATNLSWSSQIVTVCFCVKPWYATSNKWYSLNDSILQAAIKMLFPNCFLWLKLLGVTLNLNVECKIKIQWGQNFDDNLRIHSCRESFVFASVKILVDLHENIHNRWTCLVDYIKSFSHAPRDSQKL